MFSNYVLLCSTVFPNGVANHLIMLLIVLLSICISYKMFYGQRKLQQCYTNVGRNLILQDNFSDVNLSHHLDNSRCVANVASCVWSLIYISKIWFTLSHSVQKRQYYSCVHDFVGFVTCAYIRETVSWSTFSNVVPFMNLGTSIDSPLMLFYSLFTQIQTFYLVGMFSLHKQCRCVISSHGCLFLDNS